MAKQRAAYQTYVGDLMAAAGMSDPAGRADRIVALEKKMATLHVDRVHQPGCAQGKQSGHASRPEIERARARLGRLPRRGRP